MVLLQARSRRRYLELKGKSPSLSSVSSESQAIRFLLSFLSLQGYSVGMQAGVSPL